MTQAQSDEEKARRKKQWTDLAIQQAMASQWVDAVVTNKNILNLSPNETDAYNRLGKAYSELGQYAEARQVYAQTLKYNPNNTIAKKQLERLALLQEDRLLPYDREDEEERQREEELLLSDDDFYRWQQEEEERQREEEEREREEEERQREEEEREREEEERQREEEEYLSGYEEE